MHKFVLSHISVTEMLRVCFPVSHKMLTRCVFGAGFSATLHLGWESVVVECGTAALLWFLGSAPAAFPPPLLVFSEGALINVTLRTAWASKEPVNHTQRIIGVTVCCAGARLPGSNPGSFAHWSWHYHGQQ